MPDKVGVDMAIDFSQFEALTFDCYGTLIDWESGMLAAAAGIGDGEAFLEAYGISV